MIDTMEQLLGLSSGALDTPYGYAIGACLVFCLTVTTLKVFITVIRGIFNV